jgi:hypothetical protein
LAVAPRMVLVLRLAPLGTVDVTPRESAGGTEVIVVPTGLASRTAVMKPTSRDAPTEEMLPMAAPVEEGSKRGVPNLLPETMAQMALLH